MELSIKKELSAWAQLENLDVKINKKKILSEINLNFNFGENILILGPNGSGKTTLLKLLSRSIYPIISSSSSFKLFNNENINIWDIRKKIGFLFKDMEKRVNEGVKLKDLIISGFSGTYNSRYKNLLSNEEIDKVRNLINELDISDIINHDFNSLSEGQKRRGMIARALVYEPKLLVLDEPFSNLDIKSNMILSNKLVKLINKSVNIIYVTHSLESIIPNTNRVILIKNGKIINDGKPNQLINSTIISDLFNIPINVIKQDNYWRSVPLKTK